MATTRRNITSDKQVVESLPRTDDRGHVIYDDVARTATIVLKAVSEDTAWKGGRVAARHTAQES